jgi:hypothetical protein
MAVSSRHWAPVAIGLMALLCGVTRMASAQTPAGGDKAVPVPPAPQARRPTAQSVWRVTLRAGSTLVNRPSSGTSALPAPGLPENLGFFPPQNLWTQQVPSWYFGSGASILNNALQGLVPGQRPIVPLDSTLTSASIRRQNGAAFGVTVSRKATKRLLLELSLDATQSAPMFSPAALSGIESARASFSSSWNALLAGSFLHNATATSTTAIVQGASMEWLATGAVDIILRSTARSMWYATVGGGVVSDPGTAPSVTVIGHLAFNVGSANVPFDQTDTVVIQAMRAKRPVGILGGGWSHDLTRRWGVTADLRIALSANAVKTLLDARPTEVLQTDRSRELVLIFPSSPSLVFNNASAPSFNSTLGGPALSSFVTFSGAGLQLRTQIAGGVFLRF